MQIRRISWGGPPLGLQIMALLLGGLIVAQLVTLFLTLILPPAPKAQYNLSDVAAALRGEAVDGKTFQRTVEAGPPQISGPGWLGSEKSRADLARLTGTDAADVMLAFYTPLPFAGTALPRSYTMADDGFVQSSAPATPFRPAGFVLAQYQPPSRGGGGGMPSGTGGQFPQSMPQSDTFQSGMRVRNRQGQAQGQGQNRAQGGQPASAGQAGDGAGARIPRISRTLQPDTAVVDRPSRGGISNARGPSSDQAQPGSGQNVYGPPRPSNLPRQSGVIGPAVGTILPSAPVVVGAGTVGGDNAASPAPPPSPGDLAAQPARHEEPTVHQPVSANPPPVAQAPTVVAAPAPAATTVARTEPRETAPPTVATVPERRALFGLAPAPFVEGDFIAAMRLADGRWAVVHPAPEPFPNAWQQRVLLWFAISLALVAPFGWLFTRRLVKPLQRFAGAAEQLGRDPSAAIGPLDGPAEIGRAAHAFNLMQNRLRSFVDDRTAMVGAISHDLRTPLTRMRFRIEDVPDDVREGMLQEVDEMEAMISQVIDFIRDASTPGARERLDLRSLVDDVVEDARMVGADVTIERSEHAPVEVDVVGMRRLLDNLLENAVKYGQRARVRLTTDEESAVAEIIDDGPGLSDDEIERVFEPFYRSESARASDKAGSGLGLAVCRSIARAHGGDVRLLHSNDGFLAQIRVPLAYGAELAA